MDSERVCEEKLKDFQNQVKSLTREDLLDAGGRVLDMAIARMEGRYTKNSEKLGWARVIASIISATAGVMRDADLDDIKCRLNKLEGSR